MNLKTLTRRLPLARWAYGKLHPRQQIPQPAPRDEARELAAIPPIPCDASPLGRLTAQGLRRLLDREPVQAAWEEDHRLLGPLHLAEMTGGVNPGDQRALYSLVQALRPKNVLEIGTHIGCSTVNLALALKRLNCGPAGLVTVDVRDVNDLATQPWVAYGCCYSPRQMVERLGCKEVVDFRIADSLRFLQERGQSFDLIFLDGLHDAPHVYQEIPLALRRLNPGGFILLHDYFPGLRPLWSDGAVIAGPYRAVQRLRAEGARLTALPFGSLSWKTKLGSCVSSLALLVAAE